MSAITLEERQGIRVEAMEARRMLAYGHPLGEVALKAIRADRMLEQTVPRLLDALEERERLIADMLDPMLEFVGNCKVACGHSWCEWAGHEAEVQEWQGFIDHAKALVERAQKGDEGGR